MKQWRQPFGNAADLHTHNLNGRKGTGERSSLPGSSAPWPDGEINSGVGQQMTHQAFEDQRDDGFKDIIAADEKPTGIVRQIVNGVSGLLLLMFTGIVVVLLVLWKSP